MEQNEPIPIDMPGTYRICVTGSLESELAEHRWGMTSSPVEQIDQPEQTVLVGEVADQAALVGVINALYNAGHTIVTVERLLPDAAPHMEDTKEETY
jgi:hypothetical protein